MVRRYLRDPTFSRFSKTSICDRQTDRHTTSAYTALAWRRPVKNVGMGKPLQAPAPSPTYTYGEVTSQ